MNIYFNVNTHRHVVKREIVGIHEVEKDDVFFDLAKRHGEVCSSREEAMQKTYAGHIYWKEDNKCLSGNLTQPWQYQPVIDGECVTDWGINWGDMYATSIDALIDGVLKSFPHVEEAAVKKNAKQTNTGLYYVHIHYDGRM